MAADYTGLLAEIPRWAQRTNDPEFVAEVPVFIVDAEAEFNRSLRTWEMECYDQTDLVPAGATADTVGKYDVPSDWGGHQFVEVADDKLRILYYQRIPALVSGTNEVNWLLTKHPALYRYQALVSAEPFLFNDPRMLLWKQNAQDILGRLNTVGVDEQYSGDLLRAREYHDRPWNFADRNNKSLTFLDPREFFSLVSSALDNTQLWQNRYFTVADQKIHIYPKPELPSP